MKDLIQHEIALDLASGARLRLLYFSSRELRWIFSHDYVRLPRTDGAPEVINATRLTANYIDGVLESQIVLSMHVEIPSRLGRMFFAGVDIWPGAKTYLEFSYVRSADAYKLTEICKGAREWVRLDDADPAIILPRAFPFPVPDRVPVKLGRLRVPFRTNADDVAHFDLPERTLR
jgi:hypothetical protein